MADYRAMRGGPKKRKIKKNPKMEINLPGKGQTPPVGKKRTTGSPPAYGARRNEQAKAYGVKGGKPSRAGGDPTPRAVPKASGTFRATPRSSAPSNPRAARMAVKVSVPTTAKIAPPMSGRDGGSPATATPVPMSAKRKPYGSKKTTTANPKLSSGIMAAPKRQRL